MEGLEEGLQHVDIQAVQGSDEQSPNKNKQDEVFLLRQHDEVCFERGLRKS